MALGVRRNLARAVVRSTPISRFRDLLAVEGVGKKTYETIYRELYGSAAEVGSDAVDDQIGLF